MDFGKKGDAKKAMKLHHKEGITLKQAWKRVKSKDKKSKKRKTSSPKKRKAVSNAKKAMKLKWKEGITLKQAWKRVNKFGDTVCPPGYEPNARWAGKPGQRQCIKECEIFKVRDPDTGRCTNAITYGQRRGMISLPDGMEINPATGRLRKVCLPPNMRDSGGRCVKPTTPIVLKPGYEINPATGRQRKMCLPGEYRDPNSGRCRTIKDFSIEPLIMDPTVGLAGFGKGYRFGNSRKCGFGKCKACTGS
jgi:hypothetical protein